MGLTTTWLEVTDMGDRICAVDDCAKRSHARGFCDRHYGFWKRNGSPTVAVRKEYFAPFEPCSVDGCTRPGVVRGWCDRHYRVWRRNGDPLIMKAPHQPTTTLEAEARRRAGLAVGWTMARPRMPEAERIARATLRARRNARLRRVARKMPRLLSAETRAYVEILRGDPCSYCGALMEHIDHIEPVKHGGLPDWTNLTAACSLCNHRKAAKPLLTFLLGRLVA